MEETKLEEKEGEAKDKQISVLQQKTTNLNAELEAAKWCSGVSAAYRAGRRNQGDPRAKLGRI